MTRRNVTQMTKASLDSRRRRRSSRMSLSVLFLLAWMNVELHNKHTATAFSPRSQSRHHATGTSTCMHRPSTGAGGPRIWQMQGNAEEESTTATATATSTNQWLTSEQVKDYALRRGVIVSLSTLGPGFRAVARSSHNETLVIGYCEGFLRPLGNIIHLDKMEVYKKSLDRARKENPSFSGGGTTFGVGLLLGYLCLLLGQENNCQEAEFLAIDDEEYQHKRLVRYYSRAGFNIIKYVGDDIWDVPDRLVWGGCGTLMRQTVPNLLHRWGLAIARTEKKLPTKQ